MRNKHKELNLPTSELLRSQKKTIEYKEVLTEEYGLVDLVVEIRHDDHCGNGHNSFSLAGSIYEAKKSHIEKNMICCGAIGDTVAKYVPELSHLNRWHLCSTDEPMYYVENTTYHVKDRTHEGVEIGEAVRWRKALKFNKYPFTFTEHKKGFWQYLNNAYAFDNIEVVSIAYDGDSNYDFSPSYSLTGFIKDNETKQWYRAPFKSEEEAEEFLTALRNSPYSIVEIPTAWCEAIEPNLEAARRCAMWKDASIEQLRDKEQLLKRLPELMREFKKDIEALGFTY